VEQHAYLLRRISERMGVPPLKTVAMLPGTRTAFRVSIHYEDQRASDCVLTLRRWGADEVALDVVYQGHFDHKPITRRLSPDSYDEFTAALTRLHFDRLPDQPNIAFFGVDLWMVERAAGSFIKSVILAPQTAVGDYAALIALIRKNLPEAVRQIPPRG
jgi:hypothetical protein